MAGVGQVVHLGIADWKKIQVRGPGNKEGPTKNGQGEENARLMKHEEELRKTKRRKTQKTNN